MHIQCALYTRIQYPYDEGWRVKKCTCGEQHVALGGTTAEAAEAAQRSAVYIETGEMEGGGKRREERAGESERESESERKRKRE
jgi:hypothetical protein